MLPINVLDRDDFELELPDGAIEAHEEGHLRAIRRLFRHKRAEIRDGATHYLEGPLRIDLRDPKQVLRLACVYLSGGRAEAVWRLAHGLPLTIASGCRTDRERLRAMCRAGAYSVQRVERAAWLMLAALARDETRD
jgi:hypothetical protein